jgi:gliding motility-associated-like protein
LHATHNRAGEITYVQTGDLTIIATITTYTKASSDQADRDTLSIDWGDGTFSNLARTNGGGLGVLLPGDLRYNTYVGEHTYPGRSTYTLAMRDPNRISNILNINNGNSVSIQFYIETTFTLLNPQFQGYNNSAILLQEPIDNACVFQRFIHNPNAFDVDGDSLSFELVVPLDEPGSGVPRYVLPNAILPSGLNNISFDMRTGEFVWDSPQKIGEYNIAIRINEYRNGSLITSIIRDMQISVQDCDNQPPVVIADDRLCVIAGETIDLAVTVDDADIGQMVKLDASGGPFLEPISPAVLNVSDGYQNIPLTGRFLWNTVCNHIADPDYSVVFKGEDNFFNRPNETTGLVDLHTLRIHVSGPAPQNLMALSMGQAIRLNWDSPYDCEITPNEYFRGFTIWRSQLPTAVRIDTCGTDLRDYNYSPIKFQVKTVEDNQYVFLDENVEKGITYCYRVTAEFAVLSPGGNPYNRVESLPSDEICLQVSRDIPLITHVTVDRTDAVNGEMTIKWVPPLASDLDTIENPGPYRYVLLRSAGIGTSNFTAIPGAVFEAPTFKALTNIRQFTDAGINTSSTGYTYALDFYATDVDNVYAQSQTASSIYLTLIGTDRRMLLQWNYEVPWFVNNHVIYRENITTGLFDSIAETSFSMYDDNPVVNNEEYCYYIKSIGSYGLNDVEDPLVNLSQINCAIPVDSVPPCTPVLRVQNNCNQNEGEPISDLVNNLIWHYNNGNCIDSSDLAIIDIYFISSVTRDTVLLTSLEDGSVRFFEHNLTTDDVGCYFIIATDVNNNIGTASEIVCSETCPEYELPNAFTPNQDGSNDIFQPYPYRFISRVDMKIYTRWGNLIFETEDPDINWDGRDLNGNEVNEDVYYYTCQVYSGGSITEFVKQKTLQGFITLVRD